MNAHNKKYLLVALATLLLAGCAVQPYSSNAYSAPGFFSGLFHGFTILFSLVGSFFTEVRVYGFPNTGFWYDVGYVLGAFLFFGSSAASAT